MTQRHLLTGHAAPRLAGEERPISLPGMLILAVLIGVVTGVGSIVFQGVLSLIQNLAFYGQFSFTPYNGYMPPSPWGWWVIFVPALGALGVVFLTRNFAPEAKGHGVPEVMDAIYYKKGRIRPIVAVIKILASGLCIGTGGAVGKEGPIMQIGSAMGATLARLTRLSTGQRITLLAAGAGGGIAATFNTPVGGVLFAIELLMPEVSTRTFLPVAVATGTATLVGRLFYGGAPLFVMPIADLPALGGLDVPVFLGLVAVGLGCGIASWMFIKLLFFFEEQVPRIPGGEYLQHSLGMLTVGVVFYGLMMFYGHYYVASGGNGFLQDILQGGTFALILLVLLFLASLYAATMTLGSGGSGGVFSPSLYMGATMGGAIGVALQMLLPEHDFTLAAFAMVGMAAMVAASTGAALTAIVMLFEITRDYNIIVPMIMAVGLAVAVGRALSRETVFTIKLVRRGHRVPTGLATNMFMVHAAREVMTTTLGQGGPQQTARQVFEHLSTEQRMTPVLVVAEDHVVGVVPPVNHIPHDRMEETLAALLDDQVPRVLPDETVHEVIMSLQETGAWCALVVAPDALHAEHLTPDQVQGVIPQDTLGGTVVQRVTSLED